MKFTYLISIVINLYNIISGLKPFVISGSIDQTAKIWNIDSGACVRTINYLGPVNSIKTSLGPFDLIGSKYSKPMLLDHKHNLTHTTLSGDEGTSSSTLSEDGSVALLATNDGNIKVIETESRKTSLIQVDHSSRNEYLFHLVKTKSQALSSYTAQIYQNSTTLKYMVSSITRNLNFKQALRAINTQSSKFIPLLNSINNMKTRFTDLFSSCVVLSKLRFSIRAIEISKDNKYIISAMDKFVFIIDRETGKQINKIEMKSEITSMKLFSVYNDDMSTKSEQIIIICNDGFIYQYSTTGEKINLFSIDPTPNIISLYAYNNVMIFGTTEGHAVLYDLNEYKIIYTINPETEDDQFATSVFFDKTHIYVGYLNGRMNIFDLKNKKKVRELKGHKDSVTSIESIYLDENINDEEKEESSTQDEVEDKIEREHLISKDENINYSIKDE